MRNKKGNKNIKYRNSLKKITEYTFKKINTFFERKLYLKKKISLVLAYMNKTSSKNFF